MLAEEPEIFAGEPWLACATGSEAHVRGTLAHDPDWGEPDNRRTPHGFGDIVLGTLSALSQSEDVDSWEPRDFVGCAQALIDHGVPLSAFETYNFSPDVADFLDAVRLSG